MSSAESPNRGLSNWWKTFKKHGSSSESFSSTHNTHRIDDILTPRNGSQQSLNRPTLNFKSRSYNSVRPQGDNGVTSTTSNGGTETQGLTTEQIIRQQRDEFMASQHKFGFGNEVFGVPLEDSLNIAESLISVPSDDPGDFIRYGRIPLLVGKCGSFLKEKGLKVEGIFRVAGSSKRVKELQYTFSTPPEYGRKLNWEGYTVHDAASLFRRFLNNLLEPLVPLSLYEEFREPVKSRPRIINHIKARNDTIEKRIRQIQQQQQEEDDQLLNKSDDNNNNNNNNKDTTLTPEQLELNKQKELRKQKKIAKDLRAALKEYKILIDKLPEAQKHLLYYLLDLLTMFSDNSKSNLMPARNLAAIFQPSILSHPDHDLTPEEYALSQAVVEVLIEYSKRLLPDVKKFHNEASSSQTTNATPTRQGSTRNSTVNLLAVNDKALQQGSRPHSRSLSAAVSVPDGINPKDYTTSLFTQNNINSETNLHQAKNHTEEDEDDVATSDDDEDDYQNTTIEQKSIPTITTTSAPINIPREKQTKRAIPSMTISPPQRTRPVSMFPGSLPTGDERQSRWVEPTSPTTGEDFLNLGKGKKESWFKRLTSPSRSKHE